MKTYLYCGDFIDAGMVKGCCLSCHEDFEIFGDDLFEEELEIDGEIFHYEICCAVDRELNEKHNSVEDIIKTFIKYRNNK